MNICIPEEYERNGEKKVKWNKIGELFTGKNGKTYIKLYMIPNTLCHVFEPKQDQDSF